ncbi:hypothetical protein MTO98_15915 [Mucilaginibacter sp. SMC90]|uniref:MauE/DoxX family redox-associated membrane protein n=1 Tax=Mucilaginibacter sp. SMC90 TaxID=2929803 RepID=UPI001FB44860|nr:MauE/DoxX family redox-associated membrane protein [Mucilaginibacter sp. SMC90]UOE52563.1 hypothetical protein MTO98_15915 [Mucilaginibacter sp. SMC90]
MKRSDLPDLISFLLILMFSYAAISKLSDIDTYKLEMIRQPFPGWSINTLIIIIPLAELTTVISLLFKITRTFGYYSATVLMLIFTGYVGLAMTGAFGKVPCSCGGIISKLNWQQHFIFNLLFLSVSIYGLLIDLKERRFIGK